MQFCCRQSTEIIYGMNMAGGMAPISLSASFCSVLLLDMDIFL